jgi:hypothetical protein
MRERTSVEGDDVVNKGDLSETIATNQNLTE